jgi:hypothetical protein
MPAMKRAEKYAEEDYRELHQFTTWKNRIERSWSKLKISIKNGHGMDEDRRILSAGEEREISLVVNSAGLDQKDLQVEIVLERQDTYMGHRYMKTIPMGLTSKKGKETLEYKAQVITEKDGSYRFNCRILPKHSDLYNPYEVRLVKWLD